MTMHERFARAALRHVRPPRPRRGRAGMLLPPPPHQGTPVMLLPPRRGRGAAWAILHRRPCHAAAVVILCAACLLLGARALAQEVTEFPVPAGSHPHDVAPARDGGVWFTAQGGGALGRLDPATGEVRLIALGEGSSPHGVIVGPDGAAYVTDGGLNAIVVVGEDGARVDVHPLPDGTGYANLNTAAFDADGDLWFTGQAGVLGRFDPEGGGVEVTRPPRGAGPYGIAATPSGEIYFASLAGSYLGKVDRATMEVTVLEPPTPNAGVRRVWSDSRGRLWVSEWNAGQVAVYDPADGSWREWRLPGPAPHAYGIWVDEHDRVWLSDFGRDVVLRFDPVLETFAEFDPPSRPTQVRQLLGRTGEVWGAGSASDTLLVIRHP